MNMIEMTLDVVRRWIRDAETDSGLEVRAVVMNPVQYADLRKSGRDYLDFVTDKNLMRSGLMATIGGVEVRVLKRTALDTIVMRMGSRPQEAYGPCLETKDKVCRHESCRAVCEITNS